MQGAQEVAEYMSLMAPVFQVILEVGLTDFHYYPTRKSRVQLNSQMSSSRSLSLVMALNATL